VTAPQRRTAPPRGQPDDMERGRAVAGASMNERHPHPRVVRSTPPPSEPGSGPAAFFDKDGFVPPALGIVVRREASLRLGRDRRLWRYHHGVYRPDGDAWTRARARELVGRRFRRRQL